LILGDAVHKDDVAWINSFREGIGVLQRTLETLDKLADLSGSARAPGLFRARSRHRGFGGHHPGRAAAVHEEAGRATKSALAWLQAHLRLRVNDKGEHPGRKIRPYLLRCPWFDDYARHGFEAEPEDFVEPLVTEMIRSGATEWREEQLIFSVPHKSPPADWPSGPARPKDWPRIP